MSSIIQSIKLQHYNSAIQRRKGAGRLEITVGQREINAEVPLFRRLHGLCNSTKKEQGALLGRSKKDAVRDAHRWFSRGQRLWRRSSADRVSGALSSAYRHTRGRKFMNRCVENEASEGTFDEFSFLGKSDGGWGDTEPIIRLLLFTLHHLHTLKTRKPEKSPFKEKEPTSLPKSSVASPYFLNRRRASEHE